MILSLGISICERSRIQILFYIKFVLIRKTLYYNSFYAEILISLFSKSIFECISIDNVCFFLSSRRPSEQTLMQMIFVSQWQSPRQRLSPSYQLNPCLLIRITVRLRDWPPAKRRAFELFCGWLFPWSPSSPRKTYIYHI